MPDHHRLTRYIVYANGTTFMGMLKQNNTHPELFGPDFDWTHGPYVLASEADAEIERLRAELAEWKHRETVSNRVAEKAEEENDRLRAEVERLRAALETAAKRFDYIAAGAPREIANPVTGAAEARASAAQQKNERMSAAAEALASASKSAYYETHDPPHCPTCGRGR